MMLISFEISAISLLKLSNRQVMTTTDINDA